MFNNIAVIGMGYVGIPEAAVFAETGVKVTGIQRRSPRSGWKIEHLNQGKSPIGGKEPGLDELIEKVVAEGNFTVTDKRRLQQYRTAYTKRTAGVHRIHNCPRYY
jgi:UDP-N-acetyl-D-mannosaminuronic acid dehydrogenase